MMLIEFFLEKLTLQARFHGSFEPRVPLLSLSILFGNNTLLAWGQYQKSILYIPHHFGLLWVQVLLYIYIYISLSLYIYHIRPLHFAGATLFCKVCRCTDLLLFCLLAFLFGCPRFSLFISLSVYLSIVHIHIYLLSSLCWVGNQSLGTQAHYPCTVSTIRVMILWLCCVVISKIYLWFLSAALYSFHVPAIGAVVLLHYTRVCTCGLLRRM